MFERLKVPGGSLLVGDCVETMQCLGDESVHAVVCDPPYGLRFMGARWDGEREAGWHLAWALEALRVLKPGGWLFAFGGTRTWHRLACGIEDAGFELRDTIAWVYGNGMPKGTNVRKAIEKSGGSMACALHWDGWNTTLKPAFEPIVCARKPLDGSVIHNSVTHGCGGLNVDAARVKAHAADRDDYGLSGDETPGLTGSVYGSMQGTRDAYTRPVGGRWPPNFALSHLEGCVHVGSKRVRTSSHSQGKAARTITDGTERNVYSKFGKTVHSDQLDADGLETLDDWRCVEGCPVRELGEQSGKVRSSGGGGTRRTTGMGYRDAPGDGKASEQYHDKGTAARFFPAFRYQAKAPKSERWFLCKTCDVVRPSEERKDHKGHEVIQHPTQKPIELMRWLLRLVVPEDGLVVDPFVGSGTTAVSALLEGRRYIVIEKDPDFARICVARVEDASTL